jgi:hypothetical protein
VVTLQSMSRDSEATIRFEERRQRERTAPRLTERIPTLATLRLNVSESQGVIAANPKYARIFAVETSPAVFAIACANPSCRDGGHDLTHEVLRGLSDGKTEFALDERCRGIVGTADCSRILHVEVAATYR